MVLQTVLTADLVYIASSRPDLHAYYAEVRQCAESIVAKAMEKLLNSYAMVRSLAKWRELDRHKNVGDVLVGGRTLVSYPRFRVPSDKLFESHFRTLLKKLKKNQHEQRVFHEQVVNRFMLRWLNTLLNTGERVSADTMAEMRLEFKELKWNSTTRWLFSIFVELQLAAFDVYMIDITAGPQTDQH